MNNAGRVHQIEPITPFALLAKECPEALQAIQQALGYAASQGARYICACNGLQWLFGLTFVAGEKVEEHMMVVFDSLGTIRDNFRLFWSCFSQDGIKQNLAYDQLLVARKQLAPARLSRSVPGYPVPSRRNVYVNELSYILQIVWDSIGRVEPTLEFLQHCYVPTQVDNQLIEYAKHILETRLAGDMPYHQPEVKDSDTITEVLRGSVTEKPFVLLGEIGHGKTTFLRYLRLVAAEQVLSNYLQLEIDFLDRPDSSEEVAGFIYSRIEQQLMQQAGIDIFEDSIVRGVLYID